MKRRTTNPEHVTAVELLTITPGDRLVVTCPLGVTRDQALRVGEQVAKFAGIDPERVLVVQNARVSVLREGEPPPPPVAAFPETAA